MRYPIELDEEVRAGAERSLRRMLEYSADGVGPGPAKAARGSARRQARSPDRGGGGRAERGRVGRRRRRRRALRFRRRATGRRPGRGAIARRPGPARLPGGRVRLAESLDQAASRWLAGCLRGERVHLEQLYTFGEPGRDPTARVVSVAYLALLPRASTMPGMRWYPAAELPALAYDHDVVARIALARLRAKLGYTNIAYSLLPPSFTLAELQSSTRRPRPSPRPTKLPQRALALGLLEPLGNRASDRIARRGSTASSSSGR